MATKRKLNLFNNVGAHVIVDGQFGSTGKGALAAWLASESVNQGVEFAASVYSGGPNSGHTYYDPHGVKHVNKQLPSFACALSDHGINIPVYLSGGAVINLDTLFEEAIRYPMLDIYVHPQAAVVTGAAKRLESGGSIAAVASTGSGTGGALIQKIMRDPAAVWKYGGEAMPNTPANVHTGTLPIGITYAERVAVEVAQGFSLGIHSDFYPKVTSRECTVMQGLADARIPADHMGRCYMSVRTYPIRVGNTAAGDSGGWYPDQVEVSWEDLEQEPELTTVTKRVRRIATWSDQQFMEALAANAPDFVFCNFMNYLKGDADGDFRRRIAGARNDHFKWFDTIWGYGPLVSDIKMG